MTTPTSKPSGVRLITIPDRLYFRIGDVAELLGVKPHVLRYWESEFPVVSPQKSSSGQRVYRRSDVETLVMIRHLLHEERYSIEGARKRIRELRKDGGLRSFKQETVTGKPAISDNGPTQDSQALRINEVREAAESLANLASKPLSELFRY